MYCKNCGNKLADNDKSSAKCEVKKSETNVIENKKQTKGICNKILSNKVILIMFFINYMICVLSMIDCRSGTNIISELYGRLATTLLANPFYIASMILCLLNISNYKKGYVISCLIFSILMIVPTLFFHLLAGIEGLGIYRSNIILLIYIIQSLLLILTCAFKLVFNVKV